jgi:hypothetical protein
MGGGKGDGANLAPPPPIYVFSYELIIILSTQRMVGFMTKPVVDILQQYEIFSIFS